MIAQNWEKRIKMFSFPLSCWSKIGSIHSYPLGYGWQSIRELIIFWLPESFPSCSICKSHTTLIHPGSHLPRLQTNKSTCQSNQIKKCSVSIAMVEGMQWWNGYLFHSGCAYQKEEEGASTGELFSTEQLATSIWTPESLELWSCPTRPVKFFSFQVITSSQSAQWGNWVA